MEEPAIAAPSTSADQRLVTLHSLIHNPTVASTAMVLNFIIPLVRRYVPAIMLPVAMVIGAIGYNLERAISDRSTPSKKTSISQDRDERILEELTEKDPTKVDSVKELKMQPGSVLNRNLSPSLN